MPEKYQCIVAWNWPTPERGGICDLWYFVLTLHEAAALQRFMNHLVSEGFITCFRFWTIPPSEPQELVEFVNFMKQEGVPDELVSILPQRKRWFPGI